MRHRCRPRRLRAGCASDILERAFASILSTSLGGEITMAGESTGAAVKHGAFSNRSSSGAFGNIGTSINFALAKSLGCKSVELCSPDDWPTLKKHGLTCAIAFNGMPMPPFVKGFNNPKYHCAVGRSYQQSNRRCRGIWVPQRDRLQRLQMARSRRPQQRRNFAGGRGQELRRGIEDS